MGKKGSILLRQNSQNCQSQWIGGLNIINDFPKGLSPRLEDKLTLETEEGTKLVSALYSSWRSTKTDIRMSMVK